MYIAPQTREEDATSIDAAMAMRDKFAHESPAMRALFDALVELLTPRVAAVDRAVSGRP